MTRISTNMQSMDMLYHMGVRQYRMNRMQNKMASQQRLQYLRDDPLAAARAVRFQSALTRMGQFSSNVERVRGELRYAEGYLNQGLAILQRARELAVQGATGTFSGDELKHMGKEVDELLNQMVEVANAQDVAGRYVFAGFSTGQPPFRVSEGYVRDADERVVTAVEYVGDIGRNLAEISDGSFVPQNIPGNHAFWAEQQQIYSTVDASGYRVPADSLIVVDGVEVQLREGDTVQAVAAKINDSGAGVKASLDPVANSLVLSTTYAHQMWLEDGEGSTVLQDLGIISRGVNRPPLNTADSARVFGGSTFDMLIQLRDALLRGDHRAVGGEALGGIDLAIENSTATLAQVGSYDDRLDAVFKRLEYEIPEVTQSLSNDTDLDLAGAVTELKMLEYVNQAAMATAARVLQPTLLNFLR